jgi:hypothetical protein
MLETIRCWLKGGSGTPFTVEEIAGPDSAVHALFLRSFRVPAPDLPLHFIARSKNGAVSGYVHYTRHETGVYLCGGLCVDVRAYKELGKGERSTMRAHGSLSRWLLQRSITLLPEKKAVFAYTGNVMSLRDGLASDFVATSHRHLIVQWHAVPLPERDAMISRIASIGPF